ncbi:MAG: type II toxin-antitoxin system Phd/YefM family antitoxin [Patescibacteria group bacterium]
MDIKTTISSTEARKNFAEVVDKISNAGARYTLTVNGRPKVVMLNAEEYDSWMETLDIMSNPETVKSIKQSEKEFREGKFITLDELNKQLGL